MWPTLAVAALLAAVAAGAWGLSLRSRLRAAERPRPPSGPARDHRSDAEAALAEVRREKERILDTLADAFFHLDAEGRFTRLNRAAREMLPALDLEIDDLLGTRLVDAFPGAPERPGGQAILDALNERTAETAVVHQDTMGLWLEIRAFPAHGGGASVYVRDVTERVETEEQLRETRERFRTLVEHAPEAVVVLDAETEEVVDFNQNALELFGRSPEELQETAPFQFSPPRQPDGRDSVEAAREYVRRALEGDAQVFEWVHLTGDGRVLDTEVRLVRLPSRERKLVRGSVTDITDRKRAERALRESEERYRNLFEQDVAGHFITDVEGRLKACNPAFARIFGFDSVDDAVGTNVYALYPEPRDRHALLDALREEETKEFMEVEAQRTDGSTVHLVENVRGVFDEDGELRELRGHLLDVTEQKDLEKQLQRAQKLEAVGRLAGGIAHDFNNLLTTVTGHADLLLMNQSLPPQTRDDVRKIRRAARRAAKLTSQLLAFSRRQVLQSDVLSLNRVVRDVTEMLTRLLGEDVEIRTELSDELWDVEADPSQIEQVVMNLALNARDAMPGGGLLVLSTKNVRIGQEASGGGDREVPPGRYACLEVRDTGQGIPEARRDKIFEPFFTTKEPGKGTGLGLAMVYGIVTQSGGHVTVDSEVGKGAAFRILLPAKSSGWARMEEEEGEVGDEEIDEATILVYQEDPVVRKLVCRILQRGGHGVLEAETTAEARAFIREWRGEIHLFVTDTLEDGDVGDLHAILGGDRPRARTLLTATKGDGGGDARAAAVLRTPFSPRDLTRRVAWLLGLGSDVADPLRDAGA